MAPPVRLVVGAPLLAVLVAMAATSAAWGSASAASPPADSAGAQAPDAASAVVRWLPRDPNPCLGPERARLLCPDLRMAKPFGLFVQRTKKRRLLRAGNSIDSVGAGPAELRGVRITRRTMRAFQRIHTRDGRRMRVETGARLRFKYAHLRRRWWKFHHAARFELWKLDSSGRRTRLVRTGPKVSYCLRDLRRTKRRVRRSPRREVYPACSTSSRKRKVTLGTSPGWSDIYPPRYPEQYIDVTRLRGCYAYVHIADPRNGIYESNEDNNEAEVVVRLPFRRGSQRRCPRQSEGAPYPDRLAEDVAEQLGY